MTDLVTEPALASEPTSEAEPDSELEPDTQQEPDTQSEPGPELGSGPEQGSGPELGSGPEPCQSFKPADNFGHPATRKNQHLSDRSYAQKTWLENEGTKLFDILSQSASKSDVFDQDFYKDQCLP